ncbi:MAG TPA: hypothetical protein VGG03_20970 [Thermoanaerobaculia bacterium]|jgi:hypothetical protein
MRDDEIDDTLEDLPPDDPGSLLERLDAGFEDEDFAAPGGPPPSPAPMSQQEIDDVVDQVLTEELARLKTTPKKQKD